MIPAPSMPSRLSFGAAIAFIGLILLGSVPLCGQPDRNPETNATEAWRLTKAAENQIMDSLNWRRCLQMLAQADSLMQGVPDSMYWAESAFLRGRSLRRKGDFAGAIRSMDVAIHFWRRTFDRPTERLAEALMVRGHCQLNLRQYEAAGLSLDDALSACRQSIGMLHFKTASVFNVIGLLKEELSDTVAAIANYRQAIDIYAQIAPHPFASYPYSNLGNLYSARRDFSMAIPNLKNALAIRERYLPADHPEFFPLLHQLAFCLEESGDMDAAFSTDQRAMEIARKRYGENSEEYAITCSDLSFFCWSAGKNLKQGITAAEQAIEIFKHLGKEYSGDCRRAYNNLASCYTQLGDRGKALRYHQKALQICQSVYGPDNCEHTAAALINLASAYANLGDCENAIRYDTQALNIRLACGEKLNPNTALIYNNIGNYYLRLGKDEESLRYLHQSEEIYFSPAVRRHFQCYTPLENLGWFYLQKKDFPRARAYFEKAVAAVKNSYSGKNALLAGLTLRLAEVELAQNHFEDALMLADSALQVFDYDIRDEATNAQYLPVDVAELQAEIHRRQYLATGDSATLAQSRTRFRKVLDRIYRIALDFNESASKSRLIFNHYASFEKAILAETADGRRSETAFDYAERSKALVLNQSFRENGFWASSDIPDLFRDSVQQLRWHISELEKQQLTKLRSGLQEADTAVLAIDVQLLDANQAYEGLMTRAANEYPRYAQLKKESQTPGIRWLQDSLLQSNEALLEYFAGDSNLILFVVLKDKWFIRHLKLDFPLEAWISSFRHGIFGYYTAEAPQRSDSLKNAALQEYVEYAQRLYDKLIAPVKDLLPERIIIAPDGPLGYLPFDALLTAAPPNLNNFKTYPYLLQQYQISYTYSASLLKAIREKKDSGSAEHNFLAFAPYYQEMEIPSGARRPESGPGAPFTPLPYTKSEVEELCRLTGGALFIGDAATKTQFLSQAGQYRVLHIATHGSADNHFGSYAYIAFAPAADSSESELLYLQDLYAMRLNADLVVLSACETGLGKWQRGEGIISVARAFAYAGARSVVTSLWAVNDKSTSDLMRLFYRELIAGKSKDEALRQARKSFLQASTVRNAHPFFWAAFVPSGDMRPLKLLP